MGFEARALSGKMSPTILENEFKWLSFRYIGYIPNRNLRVNMARFFEFVGNHWLLWLAFVVVLILLAINEWLTRQRGGLRLSPQEVVTAMNRDQAQVIDVRNGEAFRQGHIRGSRSIPLEELSVKLNNAAKNKATQVIFVCQQGQHVPKAVAESKKHGYTNVAILQGGIQAWQSASFPLEKM